jgi:hypothetical protein
MTAPNNLTGAELERFAERLAGIAQVYTDAQTDGSLQVMELPVPSLFQDVLAYHVRIDARRKPIELTVADVRGQLVLLGSVDGVDELARRAELRLTEPADAAEFLRFWCRVALRHTDQLVESPADFRWIPGVSSDGAKQALADRAAHLARRLVVGHPARGVFAAEGTVLEQRTLQLRRWRVTDSGHVDEVERVELMRQVPVPYTMI